ncbi:hypothetical protein BGZ46_003010 [Entomortierella lignicola]|nr:hypothetical protein BGZ46_003010 [Entomortierella lignicola]
MSSARPARSSARQSALRQQEQEAEMEAERQRILSRNSRNHNNNGTNGTNNDIDNENNGGLHSSASSSRSLSPALSESASLSSEGPSNSGDNNNINQDDQDPSKPFSDSNMHSYWEIALVYGFLIKFKSLLRQSCPLHEFSFEDLEAGILSKSTNVCIEEIHANLLSNMLNRKKAVDSTTWQKVLLETLDSKYRTGEMEYDQNPLRYYGNYYQIPPLDRVHVLKALVHWVLQEGTIIRQGIEDDNERYSIEPFGTDQAKRVYWYFGDASLRIFRETKNPKKKSSGWETVATNLDEIRALAESFNGTSSKPEKALHERLLEEIIQPIEEKTLQNKLKQERLEKRMHKLAELHQLAATRTTRTRSSNRLNQPKYNYDDDEEDEFDDEYDIYRRPSSRRRHNNDNDSATEAAPTPIESSSLYPQSQQEGLEQRERSVSVEDAASSARSSVGPDSDTSIRVAMQRTRVSDEEGSSKGESRRESIDREDSVDDSENTHNPVNPGQVESSVTEFASTPLSEPDIASAPALLPICPPVPVHAEMEDVEMKSADLS